MEIEMNLRFVLLLLILNYTSAQDANCDFFQNVLVGQTYYVFSPKYANNYTGGVQCRWIATCPSGYNCRIECPSIVLPDSQSCSLDHLLVSRTGDPQLVGADTYCGQGSLSTLSTGQRMTIGLITDKNSPGGNFICQLAAQAVTPSVQCSCGYGKQNRIVGGTETGINEFPMMVGLAELAIRQIKCGATIISSQYVLTAAHCLYKRAINDFAVVVGEHDVTTGDSPATQGYAIRGFTIHPQYNVSNYDYDIAIVKTMREIAFNDRVGPVCLPFKFGNDNFSGKKVTILGWGTTSIGGPTSNVLKKVDLNVISQNSCKSQVSSLTNQQMCTYTPGKDACQDDSGGPLLYTDPATGLFFSVGIISYGNSCASQTPGINTRITTLLDWIVKETPNSNYCRK